MKIKKDHDACVDKDRKLYNDKLSFARNIFKENNYSVRDTHYAIVKKFKLRTINNLLKEV